jgi:hypothetical protein
MYVRNFITVPDGLFNLKQQNLAVAIVCDLPFFGHFWGTWWRNVANSRIRAGTFQGEFFVSNYHHHQKKNKKNTVIDLGLVALYHLDCVVRTWHGEILTSNNY